MKKEYELTEASLCRQMLITQWIEYASNRENLRKIRITRKNIIANRKTLETSRTRNEKRWPDNLTRTGEY